MSFARRRISLEFRLGKGAFGDSGFNTVKLTGLRASATISKAGSVTPASLHLRVYGMALSMMNQLTTLQKDLEQARNNTVIVTAGSDDTGMSVVFIGTIYQAWADLQSAPDGVFTVEAYTGLLDQLRPLPPTSINGTADVAQLMSGLAHQMGKDFENGGVQVQLAYPYLSGTGVDQAHACARAANINMIIENNTLAIWPKDGVRGGAAVLISPETGMVGYPSWTANGLVLKTLFNPSIVFGGTVEVDSSITPACGQWTPFNIAHDLESESPGGKWFTTLEAKVWGHLGIAQ